MSAIRSHRLRGPIILGLVAALFAMLPTRGQPQEPGATVLIFEVDRSSAGTTGKTSDAANLRKTETVDMKRLVAAVERRIKLGLGRAGQVSPLDANRIQIMLDGASPIEVERVKRLVTAAGTAEFRILASTHFHQGLIDRANAVKGDSMEVRDSEGKLLAFWVPVAQKAREDMQDPTLARRTVPFRGMERLQVLAIKDDQDVTGEYLIRAFVRVDEGGQPAVDFNFNAEGGRRFGTLTGRHMPREVDGAGYRLGIILDGELRSAPVIRSRIEGAGRITGNFTRAEVDWYVDLLNAGPLPARLQLVQEPGKLQPKTR